MRLSLPSLIVLAIAALPVLSCPAAGQQRAVACPSSGVRVVRSAGGVVDYLGTAAGVPELCRVTRGG